MLSIKSNENQQKFTDKNQFSDFGIRVMLIVRKRGLKRQYKGITASIKHDKA